MKMAFSSFFCYSNENKIILFWFFQIIERKVLDSFSNLLDRPLQYAIIFKRKKENYADAKSTFKWVCQSFDRVLFECSISDDRGVPV